MNDTGKNGPELASVSSDDSDNVEEGWEDVDGDNAPDTFVSLFDTEQFQSVLAMFEHCKAKYNFDVWKLQKEHDLDFLALVKLVNYVRRSVSQGTANPDVSSTTSFDDDYYLMPAMESDAVLYNLEEILVQSRTVAKSRVEELEEQMAALQARFDAYRDDVSKYLDDKFENLIQDGFGSSKKPTDTAVTNGYTKDDDYFHSYSFNAIHETMLKDRVRTDAYRDFIYDNKDVFKDKVVLDVGCGTGILSMFCAKAGAKQVFAVDNSAIINTAREIIFDNKLDDKIHCIKGKIEEIVLPVEKVDIIVSEWMGYCLLYESMFDSVIYARDKYLTPNGLMVPSHASLKVGAVADSDFRDHCIDFWNDVYSFDLSAMKGRTEEECLIRTADPEDMTGSPTTFKILDLRTVSVSDLSFAADFKISTDSVSQCFDGFLVWFDIFFKRPPAAIEDGLEIRDARKRGITAFSTGPFSQSTHWQQGLCLASSIEDISLGSKTIDGKVTFEKQGSRALNIKIQWQIGDAKPLSQAWHVE